MTPSVDELRRRFAGIPEVWVATQDADGAPHIAPGWFVWREDAVWIACDRDGTTWRNVEADERVAVGGDVGTAWAELAGFSLRGTAEAIPAESGRMREPISAWHEKYRNLVLGDGFERLTGRIEHLGFLRVEVDRVEAWDHAGAVLPGRGGGD